MVGVGKRVSLAPNTRSLRSVMEDDEFEPLFAVNCPYCGEDIEIYIEPDVHGTFVQDCEVCCNPWLVRVSRSGDGRSVSVSRADGSE